MLTEDERKVKIEEMRERLKSVSASVQLERIWWHQTHCFKCEGEVAFDAAICPHCNEEIM